MKSKADLHIPAVLMLGVVSQIAQVLLLRELLMVFHGNELSMGIILCAWLGWVGAGGFLGARLVRGIKDPFILFKLSAAGIFFILPLTILLIRIVRGMFDIPPGAYLALWDMAAACFVLMGPVCLILGAQFVILSRIWREKDRAADTSGAAKTYVLEATGNMLGGLMFTLVMVHVFDSFQTALTATLLMLLPVLLLTKKFKTGTGAAFKNGVRRILVLVLGGVPAFFLMQKLDEHAWSIQWNQMAPQHELVGTYQSKHGNITVLRRHDQYSFFQSGNLIFSTAGPETMDPGLEEQEAVVFAHMSMVQHPAPKNVLLIGGGMKGTLTEAARHPMQRIDYIELDPVLTRAAEDHVLPETKKALQDPRVSLIHTDARMFVKTTQNRYDLVIIDVPDPGTAVLNRYYTKEFFSEAREILNPGGVLVTGLISTPDMRGRAIANRNAAIYHTLSSVFNRVLPVGDRFLFYFATDSPSQISHDPAVLRQRYEQRGIEAHGFSGLHFQILFQDSQLRRVNWIIRNHGRSPGSHLEGPASGPVFPDPVLKQEKTEALLPPVQAGYFINSDFKPVGYFYTLMFWEELTRHDQRGALRYFLGVKPWWVLFLVIVPVSWVSALRIISRKSSGKTGAESAVLFTAFATGLSTMALQMALLFSFQNIYGFVYETAGLIVAMFMLGLALGAFGAQSGIKNKASTGTLAIVQLFMAASALIVAAVLPAAAGLSHPALIFAIFSALTFGAGFMNGIDFPLVMACHMHYKNNAEKSAGTIYGTELAGACFGAVLAGVVVIPVLGIIACCLLAATAGFSAFFTLIISRRPYA